MKKISVIVLLFISCSSIFGVTLYKDIRGFRDQSYWGGKAKIIDENGKKVLELTSSVKGDRHYGRAFVPFWTRELFLPDTELTASVKVRGKGKFFVGILKYLPKQGAPIVVDAKTVELEENAKEVNFSFILDRHYEKVYPYLQVNGDSIAFIESFKFDKVIDPNIRLTVKTPLQILSDGQTAAPVIFSTSVKNGSFAVTKINGSQTTSSRINSDTSGNLTIPEAKYSKGTNHICISYKGVGANSYVSIIDKNVLNKSDVIARKIKLKKPIRILMLGDSLSDYYRGYNYIDRINFWINKYNPGKFSFHNAGVGGDFLERASNRMEVELKHMKKWVYRQEMYNGIFKDEYDYVFIFMGQNDTRCMPKDNYSTPETTVAEQQKYLPLMLKRLKEQCPKAKVVLLAPSPSDKSVFEGYLAKGKKYPFYGKTKFVDDYDAYNRKFCKENKLDYIDILSKMRNHDPLKALYGTDGVHLSDKGGILIADEILKYFAKEFK